MNKIFLFLYCSLGFLSCLWGQKPLAYWSFETKEKIQKSNEASLTLRAEDQILSEEGIVGNFLRINGKAQGNYIFKGVQPSRSYTLEFWMRIPSSKLKQPIRLFTFSDNSLLLRISFPKIYFTTSLKTASGQIKRNNWAIALDGMDREGFQYYTDEQWHHWVIKYDPKSGKKEIWIDGQLPKTFAKVLKEKGSICLTDNCKKTMTFGHHPKYDDYFMGDLDELIIYDGFISPQLHYQHYLDGRSGRTYSNKIVKNHSIPKARQVGTQIDQREFAPGHPQVRISALDQLSRFPLPRFQPGHSLHRQYNWIEPIYLGGHKSPGVNLTRAVQASTDIQEELAVNWNYTIMIHNAVTGRRGSNAFVNAWAKLANKYPDIPLGITTLWAQVILDQPQDKPMKKSNITSKNLGPEAYVKNTKGQFIDRRGKVSSKNKTRNISPILPDHYIEEDARMQGSYLVTIQKQLTRPINIINENGEVPYTETDSSVLLQDPAIVADKKKMRIDDWMSYQAIKKTYQRSLYRDVMLKTANLENIEFSWYAIDGGPINRYLWKPTRTIQTPRNGQYYATPDFYPRWPDNWYKWAGAWRGWKWIEESRKGEILAGDRLYSPFVAAGWSSDPERNLRPSQYLGLLKNLSVVGAEFFYSGFFNVTPKDVANPINYVWQAAYPTYAQAISSRYEEILLHGNVVMDAEGIPMITASIGNPQLLATVRKHQDKDIFIIAATIQPLSNQKGIIPDEANVDVMIGQEKVQVLARRQGSVYYYDKSNPTAPIFYQLDGWHETGHPWNWTKDFSFEAEVFDFGQELSIQTEFPTQADQADLRSWTSYLEAQGQDACAKYMFEPRSKENNSFELRIRARKVASTPDKVEVILDDQSIGTLTTPNSSEWKWYTLKSKLNNLSLEPHMLSVHLPRGIHIDQILLKQK